MNSGRCVSPSTQDLSWSLSYLLSALILFIITWLPGEAFYLKLKKRKIQNIIFPSRIFQDGKNVEFLGNSFNSSLKWTYADELCRNNFKYIYLMNLDLYRFIIHSEFGLTQFLNSVILKYTVIVIEGRLKSYFWFCS